MQKFVILLAGASVLALTAPPALQELMQSGAAESDVIDPPAEIVDVAAERALPAGRSVRIKADPSGHFRATARLNGRSEAVMIDTGATSVALSEPAARRIGLRLSKADFIHTARTAGGNIAVARAMLDRLEIGGVVVRDVEVMVAEGEILGETLVGM